jgi:hypothetical protein
MNARRGVWVIAVTALFGINLALAESAGAVVRAGAGVRAGPGVRGFGFMRGNILFNRQNMNRPIVPPPIVNQPPITNGPPISSRSKVANQVGRGVATVDPCGAVTVLMPCAALGVDPMLCGCKAALP